MNDRTSAQPSQPSSDPSNSRASSIIAGKIPKAPLVKKPRALPKAPAKPRASPKKAPTAPPVPRVPSLFTKSSNSDLIMTEITTDEQLSSQGSSRTGGSVVRVDEMDTLAGGMNKLKIKLKVPSPEENAEREKRAAAFQIKPKAIKKPPIPKVAKAVKTAKAPKMTTLNRAKTPTERNQQIEAREGSFYNADAYSGGNFPGEPLAPTGEAITHDQTTHTTDLIQPVTQAATASWAPETDFVSHGTVTPNFEPIMTMEDVPPTCDTIAVETIDSPQPASLENASGSLAIPQQEPTTNHVPTTAPSDENTPPPAIPRTPHAAMKRTKADLPNFTSSSPIPFSKVSGNEEHVDRPRTANDLKLNQLLNGPSVAPMVKKSEPSIWDIPETPQPQR
jgi:hypothetical protein